MGYALSYGSNNIYHMEIIYCMAVHGQFSCGAFTFISHHFIYAFILPGFCVELILVKLINLKYFNVMMLLYYLVIYS